MPFTSALPTTAALLFLLFSFSVIYKEDARSKNSWVLPAVTSVLFLLFSLQTIFSEGLLGFWTEHTATGLWGNQIWCDLLLAISIAWFLVVPRAKALNMRVLPWLVLIICSGCVGFTAMMARMLYLQEHAEPTVPLALNDTRRA